MLDTARFIHGIPVILHERIESGVDELNAPIYSENVVTVDNVLVYPATTDDVNTTNQIYGKRAAYTIGIPKDDHHHWEDGVVEFFGRKWRTIGIVQKGIDDLIPLEWHGKISVEAYGGQNGL